MSEHHHCPFLNRGDSRCGGRLTIDSLDHAFEHCFDVYAACPVYLELLIERRTRGIDTAVRPQLQLNPEVLKQVETHVSHVVQVSVRRSLAYRHA